MTVSTRLLLAAIPAALLLTACGGASSPSSGEAAEREGLVGAWRSHIQFSSGAFAAVKDLEFMYVFNAGGTLTESSNYDGAPPVPPAYGTWRKNGDQYEAKYAYFATKPPATFDDITKGGGWSPAGHGVLTEKITLAGDGRTYKSQISYVMYDPSGKPVEGGGEGSATGERMGF
jgi:hypothetical protein